MFPRLLAVQQGFSLAPCYFIDELAMPKVAVWLDLPTAPPVLLFDTDGAVLGHRSAVADGGDSSAFSFPAIYCVPG